MPINHINQTKFDQEVLQADTPVLVDFYAQWCGPCQMAAPILEKLAQEYAGRVKIVKVDVDQNQELAQRYQIMSIPTVVVFKNGQEVERKVGFPGEAGYRNLLASLTK